MHEFSILIGGITGSGVNETGALIARLLNRLGYFIYMHYDYPSRVRGGHSFALLRAADHPISAHSDLVDLVLALDQESIDLHRAKWKADTVIIYDADRINLELEKQPRAILPISLILKQESAPTEYRTFCMIGALCKIWGLDLSLLQEVVAKHSPAGSEQKLNVAARGYDSADRYQTIPKIDRPPLPVVSGSHAMCLGFVECGMQAYVAYPMTPTSPLLEYFAASAPDLGLHVPLPENEIAVMLMALGYAYMGIKTVVGTSGGGFSLMVEGLGLAGQAELPVVVVMGQRAGPSTGMPTKTAQTDLHFVLNAGHGEFPRLIVAPGDAEEAYYWAGVALNKAWQYQIPAFLLTDKTLGLSLYSFDWNNVKDLREESPSLWNEQGEYQRYFSSEKGVSPLAFPPLPEQVVKINSYVHDEKGITTENPVLAVAAADKRRLKEESLAMDLASYETVKVYGTGSTALLCWGSNKGVCVEIAAKMGLRVVQVLLLAPFPRGALSQALKGVNRLICVECNATGQLGSLLQLHGFEINDNIRKYDGRPFSLQELENEVKKVMK